MPSHYFINNEESLTKKRKKDSSNCEKSNKKNKVSDNSEILSKSNLSNKPKPNFKKKKTNNLSIKLKLELLKYIRKTGKLGINIYSVSELLKKQSKIKANIEMEMEMETQSNNKSKNKLLNNTNEINNNDTINDTINENENDTINEDENDTISEISDYNIDYMENDFINLIYLPSQIEIYREIHNVSYESLILPSHKNAIYRICVNEFISKKSEEMNTTCYGCIENSPGQRSHMQYGGCLYQPTESEIELYQQEEREKVYKVFDFTEEVKEAFDFYFHQGYLSILSNYIDNITGTLEDIVVRNKNLPEQRSAEWFAQRLTLVSASEAGSILTKYNNNGTIRSNYITTILKKCGVKYPFIGSGAMTHGTIFEVATQEMYETRNSASISEFGCIPHSEYSFIGASPDGIVMKVSDEDNLDQMLNYGVMIEIKNPWSRVINNSIKPDYFTQMQIQMEVCNLPICHFLETKIEPEFYSDIDVFIKDSFQLGVNDISQICNNNVPISNLASDGKEKGILLKFCKSDDESSQYKSELFPLTQLYEKRAILLWKRKQILKMRQENPGFQFVEMLFWKCEIYDMKIVERDQTLFKEDIFPGLLTFWNDVEEHKKMSNTELLVKYPDHLELTEKKLSYSFDNIGNSNNNSNNNYNFDRSLLKPIKKIKERPVINYSF